MSIQNRGFGSMDKDRQRELASKGGKAAHKKGTAHEWTADEAKAAGRKGGLASRGGRGRMTDAPVMHSQVDVGADVPGGGAI